MTGWSCKVGCRTFQFDSLRELMGCATPLRSGDELAGVAAETVAETVAILAASGWTHYPVFVVPFARVKLQDAVGAILGARHSVILLGERPGLSAHDSLGAYMTFNPRADRTDADRNCISNIRDSGLPSRVAARKLAALLIESRRIGLSGTALRDSNVGDQFEFRHVPKDIR